MGKEIVTLSIKLDRAFHKKVKLYSVEKGVTIKDLFIRHMEKLIEEEAKKKK